MNTEEPSSQFSNTSKENPSTPDQLKTQPSPPLTPVLADDFAKLGLPDDEINTLDGGELSSGSHARRRGGRKKKQAEQVDLGDDGDLSSDSRNYRRGGRKPDQLDDPDDKELVTDLHMFERDDKKKKSRRIPAPTEGSLPWSQRSGRLAPMVPDALPSEEVEIPSLESQETKEHQEAKGHQEAAPCPYCSKPENTEFPLPTAGKGAAEQQTKSRPSATQSPSGLGSLFNIKRGDKAGPPIGVYVDRDEDERKRKAANKRKRRKARRAAESSEESDSSEEEKEPKRKPVQIRLDLNLEMEVLFKAKIKGDVTITFL